MVRCVRKTISQEILKISLGKLCMQKYVQSYSHCSQGQWLGSYSCSMHCFSNHYFISEPYSIIIKWYNKKFQIWFVCKCSQTSKLLEKCSYPDAQIKLCRKSQWLAIAEFFHCRGFTCRHSFSMPQLITAINIKSFLLIQQNVGFIGHAHSYCFKDFIS